MKKNKIIYWTNTSIVALSLFISGVIYIINPAILETAHPNMGFPDYFKMELGVCKILGAIAILLPMVPNKVKEFGYAGFAIILFSASYTHIALHEPFGNAIKPLIIFGIMAVSYIYWNKIKVKN